MDGNFGTPPESVIKALSSPNGANVAKAVAALIGWGNSEIDQHLVRRSLRLMRKVMSQLQAALPDADPELIGGLCADLLDLWETGQTLDKRLKEVRRLRFPRDRARLEDFFSWVAAIQIDMASHWIGEVKKDLPKLRKALDSQSKSRSHKEKLHRPKARPKRTQRRSQ